jgi:hypothetical protein
MTAETQLKRQVKDYLNLKGYFHWHNLAGMGVYKGIPDDFVLHKGVLYGLEYKAPNGKLSENQINFRDNMEKFGGTFVEVRTLDDVMAFL